LAKETDTRLGSADSLPKGNTEGGYVARLCETRYARCKSRVDSGYLHMATESRVVVAGDGEMKLDAHGI